MRRIRFRSTRSTIVMGSGFRADCSEAALPVRSRRLHDRRHGDADPIERKAEDLAPTMSERRDIFEAEVRRLSEMCEFAAVNVETPWINPE